MMNIVIVDDDKKAGEMLATKLSIYHDIVVSGIAINGKDGLRIVKETHPDLLFLDIELPDISGIEFLEHLSDGISQRPRVVMYTAYEKYMLQAFRNQAFDYLMKPFDDDDLREIIRRVCIDQQRVCLFNDGARGALVSNTTTDVQSTDNPIVRRNDGKFLFYTNAVDFKLIDIRDVGVFAYNHESRAWDLITSSQNDTIHLKRNVSSDMILALSDDFVRVSQKHIINLNYLMEVTDNTCHFFPPFNNIDNVKVGRFFRKKLISLFSGF